jgi:hypothetical protein
VIMILALIDVVNRTGQAWEACIGHVLLAPLLKGGLKLFYPKGVNILFTWDVSLSSYLSLGKPLSTVKPSSGSGKT